MDPGKQIDFSGQIYENFDFSDNFTKKSISSKEIFRIDANDEQVFNPIHHRTQSADRFIPLNLHLPLRFLRCWWTLFQIFI